MRQHYSRYQKVKRKNCYFYIKKLINIFLTVILVLLIIINITVGVLRYKNKGGATSFGGYYIFRVISGSMKPTLEIEDLILVKEENNYQEGDIVTYKIKNNYITHRLIKKNNDGTVITKGDNNNVSDDPISSTAIQGKVIKKLDGLNNLYSFLSKYFIIIIVIFIGLLVVNNTSLKKEEE